MGTIYERPPRSSPYMITVGGAPLNAWLGGWEANSVIVDNHSTQHVLLGDTQIYCPPLTVGKVVPLPSLGRVQAQFAVPPGLNDGPPVAGQICQLTYWAEELSPHPGVPDGQVNTISPARIIGTLSATNGAVAVGTFTVPVGTQAIGFIVYGTVGIPQLVHIVGHTTGNFYLSAANPPNTGGPQMALFASSDTQVDIDMTAIAVGSSKIDVIASPVLPVVDVLTAAGVVLPVSTDLKPYDWRISGSFDGVAATLNSPTFAAGVRIVIASYVCTIVSGAAVAYAGTLNFSDAGGTFWRDAVAIPAVADSADHARMTDLRVKGLGDTPMTMALNNVLPPNVSARFSAGGYVA